MAKPRPETLACGVITCPAGWEVSRCLVTIAKTLREVIKRHHPTTHLGIVDLPPARPLSPRERRVRARSAG